MTCHVLQTECFHVVLFPALFRNRGCIQSKTPETARRYFFEQRNKGSDPKALTGKRAIRVPLFYFFLSCPWCSLWGRRPHADTNRAPNKSIKTWGRTIVAQTFGKINVCALCCSWSPDLNQMFQPLVGARCSIDWTNHPALGCNPLQRKSKQKMELQILDFIKCIPWFQAANALSGKTSGDCLSLIRTVLIRRSGDNGQKLTAWFACLTICLDPVLFQFVSFL